MRYSFWRFISSQWAHQAPVPKADLTGKTVIVLGANAGLGLEATKHFATMNPGRLILACRSEARGQAAVEKLKAETGYASTELWIVDLADFASAKRFVDKFEQDGGRLDILVENAAMLSVNYELSKDGWELGTQVSNLSSPLVAFRLLPAMIKTAEEHSTVPRIVVVSSGVHYWADVQKSALQSPQILKTLQSREYSEKGGMEMRYPITKLLNVLFVRALNQHLPRATPVVVDAVCPGYGYSELRRQLSGVRALLENLMERCLAFSAEVGSRHIVYAALAEPAAEYRGAYVAGRSILEVSDFVLSPDGVNAQARLWDELVETLGKVDPKVLDIVEKYLTA